MELGIAGPAGAVAEGGADEAAGLEELAASSVLGGRKHASVES